jgi:hypothetical protein
MCFKLDWEISLGYLSNFIAGLFGGLVVAGASGQSSFPTNINFYLYIFLPVFVFVFVMGLLIVGFAHGLKARSEKSSPKKGDKDCDLNFTPNR